MTKEAELIAAKLTETNGRPHSIYWEDMELLACAIAHAAPLQFLSEYGHRGLLEVTVSFKLFPRERHQLINQIKLIKIEDVIRKKMPRTEAVQQEMFA